MKTMVAVPCMDQVQTEFCSSLVNMKAVGEVQFAFMTCSLVYKSRTDLAELAVKQGCDYVLWLDSDILFPPSLMVDLWDDMKGRDIVTGVYHMRRPPFKPVIWKTLRQGLTKEENEFEEYTDYPTDDLFQVEGCGFGVIMMRTEVLKSVIDRYGDTFAPLPGYGEDLSFCIRARGCGYDIWCDPRIQVGHKAATIITGESFEAYRKAGGQL